MDLYSDFDGVWRGGIKLHRHLLLLRMDYLGGFRSSGDMRELYNITFGTSHGFNWHTTFTD